MALKKYIIFFILFGVIFVSSYLFFSSSIGRQPQKIAKVIPIAEDGAVNGGPKTQECPLNGAYYSKDAHSAWEKNRPLGIMIENSTDSRPQSGMSFADVVFEAVAEGGVTRFLAVFYCQPTKIVGPVRSARVYFLDMIGGFGNDPLYVHVGGANTPGPANALGQIRNMGWELYNDINQFNVGFPVFWRDYERLPGVATEHTMYSNTTQLWGVAAKRSLTNINEEEIAWDKGFEKWKFKDDAPMSQRKSKQSVRFGFWENFTKFNVRWEYNKETNTYLRFNGGKAHKDKNTGKQLVAKNVVVALMDESVAQDGYDLGQHMLYETIGEGVTYVFQDGKTLVGTWSKEDRFTQMRFFNEKQQEISFNRGPIWIAIIPSDNKVIYE